MIFEFDRSFLLPLNSFQVSKQTYLTFKQHKTSGEHPSDLGSASLARSSTRHLVSPISLSRNDFIDSFRLEAGQNSRGRWKRGEGRRGTQLIPVHQVYTIFLGCGIKRASSPPHVCLHLFQFTCRRLPFPLGPDISFQPLPLVDVPPFSSLFSHFLSSSSLPLDSTRLLPRFVAAQCHVTALGAYLKRTTSAGREVSRTVWPMIFLSSQMPRACNIRK